MFNSRVVSGDLHTKHRLFAGRFKAYCATERTEHATIARSDCAVHVCIIIIVCCQCARVRGTYLSVRRDSLPRRVGKRCRRAVCSDSSLCTGPTGYRCTAGPGNRLWKGDHSERNIVTDPIQIMNYDGSLTTACLASPTYLSSS